MRDPASLRGRVSLFLCIKGPKVNQWEVVAWKQPY